MSKSLVGFLAFMLMTCSAHGQIRVAGPAGELLVFENIGFGPGATGLTRISGTVTNVTDDHLSNVAIKAQFFDNTARVYPRPSIVCMFSIKDLVPGKSVELGERDLREMPERQDIVGGPVLRRKPVECNCFLRSLKISRFSLEMVSALHGRHILTTVMPLARFHEETGSALPWYILKDETEVEVLDFEPDRDPPYKVRILVDGRIGYVATDKLVVTPEVAAIRPGATDPTSVIPRHQQSEWEVRLAEKYGAEIAARVLEGKLWIGMTRDMALESRGKPQKMNRTLLIESTHERWEYGAGVYLEFDNGILTSYRGNR